MYTNQTPVVTNVSQSAIVKHGRTFIPWRRLPRQAAELPPARGSFDFGNLTLSEKPSLHWTFCLEAKIMAATAKIVYGTTEIVDEPIYGHNFDIPDQYHLIDQGFNHSVNDHLEPTWLDTAKHKIAGRSTKYTQMDGAHFRELCVVQGNKLAVLHLKGKNQLQPKTWLRAEYVAEKAQIPIDVAVHLCMAFKKLSITTWPVARRLLEGVVATGTLWSPVEGTIDTGLAGVRLATGIKHAADPVKAAQMIIDLAMLLDEPYYTLDEPIFSDEKQALDNDQREWLGLDALEFVNDPKDVRLLDEMYSDSMTYGIIEETGYIEDGGADEEMNPLDEPVNDELDLPGTDNPYSSHPLFDGSEALPFEFDYEISTASYSELKQLVMGMFSRKLEGGADPEFTLYPEQRAYYRQKVGLTDLVIDAIEAYIQDPKSVPRGIWIPKEVISKQGIRIPKRYWFFSVAQVKHFWALYNARKDALETESLVDPNFARVKVFIATASKREAAASIYAYRDGKIFDLFGIETIVDGEQTPSKQALESLWSAFKARFA